MMSKLLTMMTGGALVLSLGGMVCAADRNQDSQQPKAQQPKAQQPQAQQPKTQQPQAQEPIDDPAAGGATASQRDQEYLASLKKCEPLTGTERSKCIDAARKKHGQL
jgi:uncharacterized membrane protein YebE (DUF533 family)